MAPQNDSDDDRKKRKRENPWGVGADDRDTKRANTPWGSGGGPNGGGGDNDMEEMLRRARENFREVMPGEFGGGKIIFLGILVLFALWLASGFFIIQPGEQGVIQRFGAHERTVVTEGLAYRAPWPIETLEKVNTTETRRMSIGFVQTYSRTGRGGKQNLPEESLMLTSDRNIVDLDMVVFWTIKSAEDYLFNVRDQEGTIKKVAESAIREIVGQTDMFPIITSERDKVAQRAKEILQENLDEYQSGVNVSQVLIEKAEVHPDVQSAFQDVQSAKQDAEDVQNQAEAYREDILPKARGAAIQMLQNAEAYKQSVVAQSNGDAERFKAIYTAYLKGEDVTKKRIYLETMESVLGNAQKIIIDQNGEGSGVVPYLPLDELNKKTSQ